MRKTGSGGLFALGALGVAGSLTASACDHFARGPGEPGAKPAEQSKAAGKPMAAHGPTLKEAPDPCRGVGLPADQHYVAKGLCARVVATNQGELRQITFAPNGDLFGVTIQGSIRRYRDANGNGVFEGNEIVEWAKTGDENGNNCEIDAQNGFLYAGTKAGVKRFKYAPDADHGGDGEDVMVGQPGGGNHPYHPVHVYDGYMYVDAGSKENAKIPSPPEYDTERSVIKRFDLAKFVSGKPFDWSDGEVVVRGVRNVTGFTRNAAGKMIGVLSGIDDLHFRGEDIHADNPGEEVVSLEPGKSYGYPFCFAAARVVVDGKVVPPGTRLRAAWGSQVPLAGLKESPKSDDWCAKIERPLTFMQAHSSPLGITFFEGPEGALPKRYRGGAFVALHGSWDRTPSTGYKVIWIPFDEQGNAPMPVSTKDGTTYPYETVFGGGNADEAHDGAWSWSKDGFGESPVRPVGVAISPIDGALYVSSDNGKVSLQPKDSPANGSLYRIGQARPH